jgi:Ca-activated chloride channel family protein
MPLAPHACLALAIAAGLGAVTGEARQQTFRADAGMVPLYVTVLGPDGRLVTDLDREDFEVLDNGRPQPIALFENRIQPITIVIMLDMSGSMEGNLDVLRQSAVQLFMRLLPEDRARVGNFGNRVTLSPAFTSNQDDLIRSLWLDLAAGGPTPLWLAVDTAMTALAPLDGRRVVLVLSDGKDSSRSRLLGAAWLDPTLDEVMDRARTEEFMVYAIGMRSRTAPDRRGAPWPARQGDDAPDPGLAALAAESGGGYFELSTSAELGPVFAQVADELHRQYLVAFVPPERDGLRHTVTVRLRDGALEARTRQAYIAPGRQEAGR